MFNVKSAMFFPSFPKTAPGREVWMINLIFPSSRRSITNLPINHLRSNCSIYVLIFLSSTNQLAKFFLFEGYQLASQSRLIPRRIAFGFAF